MEDGRILSTAVGFRYGFLAMATPRKSRCVSSVGSIATQNPDWLDRHRQFLATLPTVRRSLPVFPDKRKISEPLGMSQTCQ